MEDETEALLIRFLGDNADYIRVLNTSMEATKTAVQAIQREAEKMSKSSADASARAAAKTSDVAKEEARKAKIMAEGQKVTESVMSGTEKYAHQMGKLKVLLDEGAIGGDIFYKASDRIWASTMNNTKSMAEGQKVLRSVMTDQEKYERQMNKLGNLLADGAISTETYDRAAAAANTSKNKIMAEGKKATEDLMTSEEKRKASVDKLNGLLGAGAISEETHRRGIKEAAKLYKEATPHLDRLAGSMNFYTTALLGGIVASGAWAAAKKAVQTAAHSEMLKITYGTLLHSDEAGAKLVKDIQYLAQSTALTNEVLQYGTRTLLQFGIAGSQVLPIMKQIGDIAGGDAERIKHLSLAFGQMNQAGRLMGQDLIQMVNAGFNPLKEIARTSGTGGRDKNDVLADLKKGDPKTTVMLLDELTKTSKKSIGELRQDMEDGLITVEMVTKAFKTATEEGGAFYGMLERNSKTLEGMWNNMKDDVTSALREIGEHIIKELDLKTFVSNMSQGLKDFTKWVVQLDPQTKALIKYVGYLVAALSALAFVVALVTTLWLAKLFVMALIGEAMVGLTLRATMLSLAMRGLTLALYGFAAYGAYLLFDMASGAEHTRREMERMRNLTEEMAKNGQAFTDKLVGWASAGHDAEERLKRVNILLEGMKTDKMDPAGVWFNRWPEQLKDKVGVDRQTELVKQIQIRYDYLNVDGREGANRVEGLRAEYDKVFGRKFNRGTKSIIERLPGSEDELKNSYFSRDVLDYERQQLETAKANLAVMKGRTDRLKEMKEQLEEAIHPAGQLAVALKDIKKELRDEINFAGLDKWEKQVAELNVLMNKLNTDATVRKSVMQEVDVLQGLARRRHNEGEMIEYLKKLNEEWLALGKTVEEAKYNYFLRHGANANQLSILGDSMKALALAKEQTRLQDEGKKLKEQFMEPTEAYRKQIEDLKEMLKWRFIDEKTFDKGVDHALQKFNEATDGAHRLKEALDGVKASAFGSAEALGKMNSFRENLRQVAPMQLKDIEYRWPTRMPDWLKQYEPDPKRKKPVEDRNRPGRVQDEEDDPRARPIGMVPRDNGAGAIDDDRRQMLRFLERVALASESIEGKPAVVIRTANL